ncbi:MAG: hypothetical protein ACFFCD_01455, partial [Promethearchaeota archaeon]
MRKCPNCGNSNIKEEVDKTKIIGYMLHEPVYEKTLVCKNCTHRWKPGEEVAAAPEPAPEPIIAPPEPAPEP